MSSNDGPVYVDNALVQRVKGGDQGAFEELFRRHQKRVYNIALRMLGDETEAADATQEVFVRAFQRIGGLSSDAAFVIWLKMMAINLCRDLMRKRPKVKVQSLDASAEHEDGSSTKREIADWSGDPSGSAIAKILQEVVQKAIGSLQPDYREVVTLFYVDGSDIAEISKVTGSPEGTVKCRLSRARAQLKRKLESYVNG